MLIEARGQVAHGSWTRWLTKNFELSQSTAGRYMKLARLAETDPAKFGASADFAEALGHRAPRERHAIWGKIRDAADRVNVTNLLMRDARHRNLDAVERAREPGLRPNSPRPAQAGRGRSPRPRWATPDAHVHVETFKR
jgi:hypothetical protein